MYPVALVIDPLQILICQGPDKVALWATSNVEDVRPVLQQLRAAGCQVLDLRDSESPLVHCLRRLVSSQVADAALTIDQAQGKRWAGVLH